MRTKTPSLKAPAEQALKDIRRATRKHYPAEDKIRIVLDGLLNRSERFKGPGCEIASNNDPTRLAVHLVELVANNRDLSGRASRPIVTPPNSSISQ